jgi:predicted amidophosphoribosyltransferase
MYMALANCLECGKLFNRIVAAICPECFEKIEKDFEKVYAFLREHGATNIDVIHTETGVDKKRIMRFLAEGRFEGGAVSYKCESCGTQISGGKLCANCLNKFSKVGQDIQKSETKQQEYRGLHTAFERDKTK